MPNGKNDVDSTRAECRTSLGAKPNGRNAEGAECRKQNSTKRMLCVILLVTFVRTMSSFINLWCAQIRHFQVLHFPSFDLFRSVIFRWCKWSAPGDRTNVCSCRGLGLLTTNAFGTSTDSPYLRVKLKDVDIQRYSFNYSMPHGHYKKSSNTLFRPTCHSMS